MPNLTDKEDDELVEYEPEADTDEITACLRVLEETEGLTVSESEATADEAALTTSDTDPTTIAQVAETDPPTPTTSGSYCLSGDELVQGKSDTGATLGRIKLVKPDTEPTPAEVKAAHSLSETLTTFAVEATPEEIQAVHEMIAAIPAGPDRTAIVYESAPADAEATPLGEVKSNSPVRVHTCARLQPLPILGNMPDYELADLANAPIIRSEPLSRFDKLPPLKLPDAQTFDDLNGPLPTPFARFPRLYPLLPPEDFAGLSRPLTPEQVLGTLEKTHGSTDIPCRFADTTPAEGPAANDEVIELTEADILEWHIVAYPINMPPIPADAR